MGRAVKAALTIVIVMFAVYAQAGELGLQAGFGRSSVYGDKLTHLENYGSYYAGVSARQWDLISNLLWPETFAGVWYSEYYNYDSEHFYAPSVRRYYSSYLGTQEGVQLMLGKRRREITQNNFIQPQVGVGFAAHQVWGVFEHGGSLFNADYSKMETRLTAKLLLRLAVLSPANREVFLEGEIHPDIFYRKPFASDRVQYLLSMGYRFSAF